MHTERDAVVLTYQTCRGLATEWKLINQLVPITLTDLHFGGRRPWFTCSSISAADAVDVGSRFYTACVTILRSLRLNDLCSSSLTMLIRRVRGVTRLQ